MSGFSRFNAIVIVISHQANFPVSDLNEQLNVIWKTDFISRLKFISLEVSCWLHTISVFINLDFFFDSIYAWSHLLCKNNLSLQTLLLLRPAVSFKTFPESSDIIQTSF